MRLPTHEPEVRSKNSLHHVSQLYKVTGRTQIDLLHLSDHSVHMIVSDNRVVAFTSDNRFVLNDGGQREVEENITVGSSGGRREPLNFFLRKYSQVKCILRGHAVA
jgi:hypothetical protein